MSEEGWEEVRERVGEKDRERVSEEGTEEGETSMRGRGG